MVKEIKETLYEYSRLFIITMVWVTAFGSLTFVAIMGFVPMALLHTISEPAALFIGLPVGIGVVGGLTAILSLRLTR